MGHDTHFLSRLERAEHSHVELAMRLYRDPPLLKLVLDEARLPGEPARIAISLDTSDQGPFALVTQEGRFVTCLGRGMTTRDAPVIRHEKLRSVLSRAELMRARLEVAEEHLSSESRTLRFYRRLHEGAHQVSREDIMTALALHPLIGWEYLGSYGDALMDIERAAVRASSPRAAPGDFARAQEAYWQRSWQVGHFALLTFAEPDTLYDRAQGHADVLARSVSLPGFMGPLLAVAARSLWAAGRCGHRLVGHYKQAFAKETVAGADAAFALAVIALGHQKYEAEIRKVLERSDTLGRLLLSILDDPDAARRRHLEVGRQTLVWWTREVKAGSPWHFATPEAVPDDLAYAILANTYDEHLDGGLRSFVDMLPWLARARAEELYLPAALLRAAAPPWTPAHTELLVERWRSHAPPREPVTATSVGRNEPCTCGSGRKFKKCCGA